MRSSSRIDLTLSFAVVFALAAGEVPQARRRAPRSPWTRRSCSPRTSPAASTTRSSHSSGAAMGTRSVARNFSTPPRPGRTARSRWLRRVGRRR